MKTIIFTDGASSGNPGPSGWGSVTMFGKSVQELGGSEKISTNNRMELTAVIESVKKRDDGEEITVYTDSQYVVNGITKWVFGWQKNNWRKSDGDEVLNVDLWRDLFNVTRGRNINWKVIRGHAGVIGNNRADEIAVEFSAQENPSLFFGPLKDYPIEISIPDEKQLSIDSDRDRKKKKAYSYLSMIENAIQRHRTWADCEERVKGVTGAKFRKSISKEDEEKIIKEWRKG